MRRSEDHWFAKNEIILRKKRERQPRKEEILKVAGVICAAWQHAFDYGNISTCVLYQYPNEMAKFVENYDDDLDDLESRIINDFKQIYASVFHELNIFYERVEAAYKNERLPDKQKSSPDKLKQLGPGFAGIQSQRDGFLYIRSKYARTLRDKSLKLDDLRQWQLDLCQGINSIHQALNALLTQLSHYRAVKNEELTKNMAIVRTFLSAGKKVATSGIL